MRATRAPGAVDDLELAGFRRAQRVAYDAAVEVAGALAAGTTEKEAADRLGQALAARGVDQYFHTPFAWFGDRSRLAGVGRLGREFFPTERRLENGMVGILDVAPVVAGYTADIGYTFRFGGPDAAFDRALGTLREVRALLPACIARGDTMRSMYVRVDRLFAERGYDNRHGRYPLGVLGHRVTHATPRPNDPTVAGFGLGALAGLVRDQVMSRLPRLADRAPGWGPHDNRPLAPGVWAVEPHLGADGFGAKFEELLVVEEGRAYWLDDDLPHVRPRAQALVPAGQSMMTGLIT